FLYLAKARPSFGKSREQLAFGMGRQAFEIRLLQRQDLFEVAHRRFKKSARALDIWNTHHGREHHGAARDQNADVVRAAATALAISARPVRLSTTPLSWSPVRTAAPARNKRPVPCHTRASALFGSSASRVSHNAIARSKAAVSPANPLNMSSRTR